MAATKTVGVRLAVQDAELVERALAQFGKQGEAALARIRGAARPASTSLEVLSASINKAKEVGRPALASLAQSALGPAAAFLTLTGAVAGIKSALEDFGTISDQAKAAGVDSEFFQGLAHAADLAGVNVETLSQGLRQFANNAGLAAIGQGALVGPLRQMNPELLKAIQLAKTQEERIKLVADAIRDETDASKRAALAQLAFGDAGVRLVDVLARGGAAIDGMVEKARNMGVIVPRELIDNADELGDKLDTVSRILQLQFEQALVDLAPLLISTAEGLATIARSVSDIIESFKPLGDRSTTALEDRLQTINTLLDRMKAGGPLAGLPGTDRQRADLQAEADQIKAVLDARAQALHITVSGGGRATPPALPASPAELRAAAQGKKLAEQLQPLLAYSDALEELQKQLAAGNIDQETFNRAMAQAALKLAGAASTSAEYAGALAALDEARAKGIVSERQYTEAVEDMSKRRLAAGTDWVSGVRLGLLQVSEQAGDTAHALGNLMVDAAGDLENAFAQMAKTGKFAWQDLTAAILADIAKIATQQLILKPLAGLLGSAFGGGLGAAGVQALLASAEGNVFGPMGVEPFANGGIVTRPTLFAYNGGLGVMGEKGNEGILPLGRRSDGKLGVYGSTGGVVVNYAPVYQIDGSNLGRDELTAMLAAHDRAFAARVPALVAKARRDGKL